MNEEPLGNAPNLSRKTKAAIEAYWSQIPGWRSLWRDALEEWAEEIGNPEDESLPEARWLASMLHLIADALADADAAIPHPLLAIPAPRPAGSPKAHSAQRARRQALAKLGASYLALNQNESSYEKCFEAAAEAVRKAGEKVSAAEIRSAWENRHSYPDADRAEIEQIAKMRPGLRGVLGHTFYVEAAAFFTKSPITVQRRGGRRR